MPLTNRLVRLRVRNAADSADAIIITSDPTQPFCLVLDWPDGDGAKLDPTSGKVDVGAYNFRVIDTGAAGANPVTANLYDAAQRLQLLSRRAYVEKSTNGGASWPLVTAGYVNAVRMTDAASFEFTVGETRRIEQTFTAFRALLRAGTGGATTVSRFDKFTSIIGGPIHGGFGPLRDHGGWRYRVLASPLGGTTDVVALRFVSGWTPGRNGYIYFTDGPWLEEYLRLTDEVYPFKVRDTTYDAVQIFWSHPRLRARVQNPDASLRGHFIPLAGQEGPDPRYSNLFSDKGMMLKWDTTQSPLPAVGALLDVYLFPVDISEKNPLHVASHPVDVVADLYGDAGVPLDLTSQINVRNAVGPDHLVLLRFTTPQKLLDVERALGGFFGFGTRIDALGRRQFFRTRVRGNALPARTITKAMLRREDVIFDLDEATVVNRVVFRHQRLTAWDGRGELPLDYLALTPTAVEFTNGDQSTFGDREHVYEIPGEVQLRATAPGPEGRLVTRDVPLDLYAAAVADETFDRFGRGGIAGTVSLVDDTVTEVLGEEVLVDFDHFPNAGNARGGTRCLQIVQRTDSVDGPVLRLLDSGATAQPATAPTFTLTKSAIVPRHLAYLDVTNVAALLALDAGAKVEVQWVPSSGVAPTGEGNVAGILALATDTRLYFPYVQAGVRLWARARTRLASRRAGTWTAWASVDLDALPVPSAFTGATVSGDATQLEVGWTNGDATLPVIIMVYHGSSGTTPATELFREVQRLPAGSTRTRLRDLDPAWTDIWWTVAHYTEFPVYGVGTAIMGHWVRAAGAGPVLAAPTSPRAFAGASTILPTSGRKTLTENEEGFPDVDGTYGMDCLAAVLPSTTVFEVAVETAVGAGTYGAFVEVAEVNSVQGDRTRFTAVAPRDGLRRALRAKHRRLYYTDSAPTSIVTINPWTFTLPTAIAEFAAGSFPTMSASADTATDDITVSWTTAGFPAGTTVVLSMDDETVRPFPNAWPGDQDVTGLTSFDFDTGWDVVGAGLGTRVGSYRFFLRAYYGGAVVAERHVLLNWERA